MKYFNTEQVVEALKNGITRRHNVYDNYAQAKNRGYEDRAILFKQALEIFDKWKQENKKE